MSALSLGVSGLGRALAFRGGPRLSILIFHRVLRDADPLQPDIPDAAAFEARMRWLAQTFRVMPLLEATRRLATGHLPPNAACITFDDGYADNLTVAAPVLAQLRLSATFFIASGYLDGGRMFNDTVIESIRRVDNGPLDLTDLGLGVWSCADASSRIAAGDGILEKVKYLSPFDRESKVCELAARVGLPATSDLMLTRAQLRELRRYGMSIGAHTATHPILTTLGPEVARNEIDEGRRALEGVLGERIRLFAYPNGKPVQDYDASHVAIVKALGFDAAVSTAWGVSTRDSDPFQLPRFTPWDRQLNRFGMRLAQNLLRTSVGVVG